MSGERNMKKYKLRAHLTVSAWTEVEAESPEEAIQIAQDRDVGSLCHGAIYPDSDEAWHFENDGIPLKIAIDE